MSDLEEYGSLAAALRAGLAATPFLPRDVAMIAVARRLADRLDEIDDKITEIEESGDENPPVARWEAIRDKLMNRYLATLDRMGMSPGARPATRGGEPNGQPDAGATALGTLTGEQAAWIDYAAVVDPSVTEADGGD